MRRRIPGCAGSIVAAVLFCVIFAPAAPAVAEASRPSRHLRVGAYDNPPKFSLDPGGQVSGFWPDLLREIARRKNWEIEYVPGTWEESLSRLESGSIDLLPDVGYTAERARRFVFGQTPVLTSWSRVYVGSEAEGIETIVDLDHKRIAVLRGSVNLEGPEGIRQLAREFGVACEFLELDDYNQVFLAISDGTADAGVTNRNYADAHARDFPVKPTPIIFQPITMRFALPRGSAASMALAGELDDVIGPALDDEDSFYYRLLRRHFETGIATRESAPSWLAPLIGGLILALGLVMMGLVLLRLEVRRKTRELQKKNEELELGERRFRTIFNSTSDVIFIHDAQTGAVLDINETVRSVYGYSPEEVSGLPYSALGADVPPYTEEEAVRRVMRAAAGEEQVFEWRAKKRSGELFWVEVSLTQARIGGRDLVIAVVRDIESRRRAQQAIEEGRERLLVTLRSISEGVVVTDPRGHVTLFNPAAERTTGRSEASAVGLPLDQVLCFEPPGDRFAEEGRLTDWRGGQLRQLRTTGGEARLVLCSSAPVLDADGSEFGRVLVMRDVTEELRMQEELLKTRRLESIGLLAGGIAHDFNNILVAVMGNIELALSMTTADDPRRRMLEESLMASERARALTGQLLTFSRGGEPVKELASIESVIRDSAEFVLHGAAVNLRYEFAEDLWPLEIDRGQISQVIQNLVLNAAQSMEGRGTIEIRAANRSSTAGPRIRITVRDEGSGIAPADISRVFDPYFSRREGGSGLGLSITHSIVERHGGTIDVDSTLGAGSEFTIELPAAPGAPLAARADRPAAVRGRGGRVLVMDDEEMVRELFVRVLEGAGYEALSAADGEQALALLEEREVDAAIIDLTVAGGMGGGELARILRRRGSTTPLIVSSGYSNDPILADHRAHGFSAALIKPFEIDEMLEVLASVIEGARR